jgi:predicted TIM-barrel fold metal-dependent hydrolase
MKAVEDSRKEMSEFEDKSLLGGGFIDVHHHLVPPKWIADHFKKISASIRRVSLLTDWSPSQSIEEMDKYSVSTAMTSLTNPGIWFGDRSDARSLARVCNEYAAEIARDYPGRFGVLATLPLPDIDGSLAEISYAFDILKADGIGLMTNYDGKWPGDPSFQKVFDELNRRKAVVYFHPAVAECCSGLIPDVSPSVLEFPFDTTRAIVSLLVGGTLMRCRNIQWIFAHAGGALPMLAHRIDGILGSSENLSSCAPHGVLYELQHLFYDSAQATNPASMAALFALVDVAQVLFGSDYPLLGMDKSFKGFSELGFTPKRLRAVGRENALRLFPRLAA